MNKFDIWVEDEDLFGETTRVTLSTSAGEPDQGLPVTTFDAADFSFSSIDPSAPRGYFFDADYASESERDLANEVGEKRDIPHAQR